jgi:hypothetical protein
MIGVVLIYSIENALNLENLDLLDRVPPGNYE